MTHIILLLYLISGFSGICSIIFLIMKYGHNSPFMKAYIKVHLTYTSIMLAALVILYIRVNVISSQWLMPLFIASILLGQGFLLYALSRFSFIINKEGVSPGSRLFWNIFPFFYFLLAALQIVLWETPVTLAPIIIGVPLFVGISIWFSIRNFKAEKESERGKNLIWFYFLLFTIVVIALEMYFKSRFGALGEYTINIPLIFLCWNALSVIQFRRENSSHSSENPGNYKIGDAEVRKWQLTDREREITNAIIQGCSNKEIASDLDISFSTVKNHIYNIYRKTGVQSRVELVNLFR